MTRDHPHHHELAAPTPALLDHQLSSAVRHRPPLGLLSNLVAGGADGQALPVGRTQVTHHLGDPSAVGRGGQWAGKSRADRESG